MKYSIDKKDNYAVLQLQEENLNALIAPELKLQVPAKVAKVKEETSLSTIIEQEIKAPEVKTPEVKAPKIKAPEVKSKEAVSVEKPADPEDGPTIVTLNPSIENSKRES